MLTMEKAAQSIFSAESSDFFSHCLDINESGRRRALACAAQALQELELLGLSCGVFGSSLRPGDFFHHSDVDMVAWNPDFSPIHPDLALRARFICHHCMGNLPFDLVLLPCANKAFESRILNHWVRGSDDVFKASIGEPLSKPLHFGPQDVAFIDRDRIAIAIRAAERMALTYSAALNSYEVSRDNLIENRLVLSLSASMQTIVRIAEKCAKDVLREFAHIKPSCANQTPLYPLLAYPCDALGGHTLASFSSLHLYFHCVELLNPPTRPTLAWVQLMASVAMIFTQSIQKDFEPAFILMNQMSLSDRH